MSKKSRARAAASTAPQAASRASPAPKPDTRLVPLAGVLIVLAALAAYYNSFSGPFFFDDIPGIKDNATIRHLWPFWRAWVPPHGPRDGGLPVAGRPVANFSLAVNYACGGLAVQGYHALNLAIHVLAGLVLFGVVRRTLLRLDLSRCGRGALTPRIVIPSATRNLTFSRGEGTPPTTATGLALAVAALWTLHPLQTESVTYIVQRAESLMGLFYLLTLYCFIRGVERRSGFTPDMSGINPDLYLMRGKLSHNNAQKQTGSYPPSARLSSLSAGLWFAASVLSCLLGMASKEVMVSAPLIVLLYDRTFVAGTFREAWRWRSRFYAGLAGTWLLLGFLVASTKGRGGSAGFGTDVTWWPYALTQFRAIVRYLQLSLWPAPLVFDYGTPLATRAVEIVPYAVIVLLLAVGTAVALWRRSAMGFFGCWFFAILAPSSSIVPVATQTMAEHRMYLALAPVAALVVLGLYSLLGRRSAVIFLALAVGLGCVTARRNEDYRSPLAIWSDTVAKCPDNARAQYILGDTLRVLGRPQEAIPAFQAALRIEPRYAQAHNSLGNVLAAIPGRLSGAISEYEAALRLQPDLADAHYNLALALQDIPGRLPDAVSEYEAALRIRPDYPEAQVNLGIILARIPGRLPEAISAYEAAIRNNPDLVEAHYNLGEAWSNLPGRMPEAISEYETALRLEPDLAEAHYSLGVALAQVGNINEGIAHLVEAVRIRPGYVEADNALGAALIQSGQYEEAINRLQQALKIKPDYMDAHNNLGTALLRMGRLPEAADQFNAALKLDADFSTARLNLGFVLSRMNRVPEAIQQLDTVVRTNPNGESAAVARKLLAQLQPGNDGMPLKN